MNYFNLVGRLTKDPDVKQTQSGTSVCNFTLAVDKNLGKEKKAEAERNNKPTADFIRIQAWGNRADVCGRYLNKGSQCAVSGRIQTDNYQDDNGNTIFATYFIAENVEFLGGNKSGNNSNNQNKISDNEGFFDDDFEEVEDKGNIPF